ncbi:50S ribosomal protein L15 [Candidatus Sumerlaeota bacterium]|nr:50S ribosomal protein L15 [Candidatus Sumerlaeota bacterium]
MKIHELPGNPGNRQQRKRVGRGEGSGHGKTSGRGSKGAQSRSGYKRKHGFEGGQMPLHRRLPKRGFKNPFRVEYQEVNVGQLEGRFESGATVTFELLLGCRLISKQGAPVKILGNGELKTQLTVEADAFTAGALKKIEAVGGSAVAREKNASAGE